MADLVLALAKSAVEGTLTVARSVEEEEKLKKCVQRDVTIISDEFEMMCSFLNVAKESSSDEMVKTLVRQVRNMALDVEDCIESVVLRDIASNWWRRWLPSCMTAAAPAVALDNAVADIELLKSRVEAMGRRNERYRHIGDSCSKPTNKEMHQQALADATAMGILMEARDAKKWSGPTDLSELINKIDSDLPLQVISVWGAVGDLGVASIIKKTCDDPKICEKFRCRAWVKLMHPFNPHDFIRSLLTQFYTNYSPQQGSFNPVDFIRSLLAQFYTNHCRQQGSSVDLLKPTDVMMATEDVLIEEFTKQVSNQRYLVFLEDVSSTVDWETVKVYLPDKKNGSCIVVHTQQLEVASLCIGPSHKVLELEQFSADHSVCVFFNENKRSNPRRLVEWINKKDLALPLQVIAVSGAVADLEVAPIIKKTCDHNQEICKIFKCRAWVKLMHPFNPHEFIRSLLAELYTNYCSRHGSATDFLKLNGLMTSTDHKTECVLIEFVKQVMSDQRYLVVLEDLSSMDDWNAVKEYLPDKNNGSCIVVHSEKAEVASLCVGQPERVLEVPPSSDDHSPRVFVNKNKDEHEEKAIKTVAAREWLDKFEPQFVGRQADVWSLSTNTSGVRGVYGIAGVGKSHIVKCVYHKAILKGTSFQKFGWVDVSHPFDSRKFSWNLLLDLHSRSLQHGSMLRIKEPIQVCRKILRDHDCLIVIDGLKSTEEWDSIKEVLDLGQSVRGYIIVIAYEESVAEYCSSSGKWWSVHGLEIDEALTLFKKKVIEKTPDSPDLSPAEIGRAEFLLHKCGGLPKVIVAVADFIADAKSFRESYLRTMSACFMRTLEIRPEFGSLRDMFAWVHSYFDSCQDSLKPCIFYLSIFPMNHNIRRRRLVRRWIAEGYSRDTKERTAEEEGETSFRNLLKLNMIQVPGTTRLSYMFVRMPLCQFNGFFREYIISRSLEENLVFTLEGHCDTNSQRTGRHLTIESSWDRDKIVYESIDFSKLRSLTVFGKWESFFISDKMRILRVLDLEDASSLTDSDLEQMVKLLPRLKFLSLRGRKEITRLPDSIGGLRKLQTLDIRHTSIVTLPQSITKLQKLQHIRAGTTIPRDDDTSTLESVPPPPPQEAASVSASMSRPRVVTMVSRLRLPWTRRYQRLPGSRNGGVEVPQGIGKMMALHNISVIDVSVASGRAILEDLKNLTQLRKLGVTGVKRENCQELCSAISGHAHLGSLSLWLDNNQAGCLDAISPPPEKLDSLKLYGGVDKLPLWIKLLSNLSKLKLQMTMITQDDVDLLMFLPGLNTLCLNFKEFQYGQLRFRAGFWRLWVLEIACNCRLQAVMFDSKVMPLQILRILCCNVSSLRFSGLKYLKNLREVSLSGSYDAALKEHLKNELDEHPGEMKPVLKV